MSKKPKNSCDAPQNSEDQNMAADDIPPTLLSIKMRTQKALDHFQFGKCGPTSLSHEKLDDWIKHAQALELQIELDLKSKKVSE